MGNKRKMSAISMPKQTYKSKTSPTPSFAISPPPIRRRQILEPNVMTAASTTRLIFPLFCRSFPRLVPCPPPSNLDDPAIFTAPSLAAGRPCGPRPSFQLRNGAREDDGINVRSSNSNRAATSSPISRYSRLTYLSIQRLQGFIRSRSRSAMPHHHRSSVSFELAFN